ncbi:phosphatidylinositol transfer 1 isoform X2 [Podarcis lilfordi]|uniref:Phosphatidylinositol transfer 1 isoform X2 n=1 Tax=Podarcis lilfordi TaxID=74358 RepID=A0AA35JVV7_9SAUR|nr:phosphatidylinositol transfer 1 isoform X2 [Podarcis lilfordi]
MPLTVEEYRIGQLYMISKHSHEQSDRGEGVEVVQNEPYEDPNYGNGQLTEKRVYLNSAICETMPSRKCLIHTRGLRGGEGWVMTKNNDWFLTQANLSEHFLDTVFAKLGSPAVLVAVCRRGRRYRRFCSGMNGGKPATSGFVMVATWNVHEWRLL